MTDEITYEIWDSLPGTGKTMYTIQQINAADPSEKIIYVTPYNKECLRIEKEVTSRKMHLPSGSISGKNKQQDIFKLVSSGKSITTTHALFKRVSTQQRFIKLIKEQGYTLILDEVISAVDGVSKYTKEDINILLQQAKLIAVDDIGNITWTGGDLGANSMYSDIYKYAKEGVLFIYKEEIFIRLFNEEFLRSFKRAVICTYLFQHLMLRLVLDLYEIKYTKYSITFNKTTEQYEKRNYNPLLEPRKQILELINIQMDGNYNKRIEDTGIGRLSYTKLTEATRSKDTEFYKEAAQTVSAFFRMCERVEPGACYHSTNKAAVDGGLFNPPGYSQPKHRMPSTARATNDYIDGKYLAYVFERNTNPLHTNFFGLYGINIDNWGYSAAEFIQWCMRSRLRNGEPIRVFIPSEKMRKALKMWANYEI